MNSGILNNKLVKITRLTKSYIVGGRPLVALNNVDLEVESGEFLAITGASGSGKSTLLQLMGGLDQPSYGEIIVDGVDLQRLRDAKLSEFRNRTIGFVFQFFYLQPFLSLRDNVAVPAMFAAERREEYEGVVAELLERVGLSEQTPQLPKQLSGGQIQRAAIARALVNHPKLLLADEPTGNLDTANSTAIINLFKEIRDDLGTTVIIVTHNPEIAAQADRELKLSDGALI